MIVNHDSPVLAFILLLLLLLLLVLFSFILIVSVDCELELALLYPNHVSSFSSSQIKMYLYGSRISKLNIACCCSVIYSSLSNHLARRYMVKCLKAKASVISDFEYQRATLFGEEYFWNDS